MKELRGRVFCHCGCQKCREVEPYGKIPVVLELLKSELLEKDGHKEEGIFRKAPDSRRSNEIKEQLSKGTFAERGKVGPHVAANLIKVGTSDKAVSSTSSRQHLLAHFMPSTGLVQGATAWSIA